VAAIALCARHLDWGEVLGTVRRARWDLLGAVVALNGLMMLIRAARVQLLLAPARAPLGDLFLAVVTSSAINNLVPLRAGDLSRLYMLESCAGISKSAGAAVAVVEKLLEVAVLAGLALLAVWFVPAQSWAMAAGGGGLCVAVLALLLLRRLARGEGAGAPAVWRRLAARLGPGLTILRSSGATAGALGASLAAWSCELVMIVVAARAVGLSVGPVLAIFVLVGINLALALPALPANAGTFESAAVVVLLIAHVHIGRPAAVAFAVVYHLIQVVPVTAVGLAVLARRGLRFGAHGLRARTPVAAVVGWPALPRPAREAGR
jgi:uncharacterized membrane protein YbhN (UPF0104 family)